ncbi:hypothetical protein EYF80_021732 [Liparis tanakae]|uniref:Uncharacterized protein n=1 Tax=Liparis tanakae TaxID=230148 RepID=A0A4Z2HQU1_9TELE|nr:hypothetical protein EYF80_021732 [Liparis tanakae]
MSTSPSTSMQSVTRTPADPSPRPSKLLRRARDAQRLRLEHQQGVTEINLIVRRRRSDSGRDAFDGAEKAAGRRFAPGGRVPARSENASRSSGLASNEPLPRVQRDPERSLSG